MTRCGRKMSQTSTFQSPKAGRVTSRLDESDTLAGTIRIGLIYGSIERRVSERYLVEPGEIVEFDLNLFRSDVSVDDVVRIATSHGETISYLVQCIGAPGLPRDLHHAVEGRLFNGVKTDRCFDLGWVGHIGPPW